MASFGNLRTLIVGLTGVLLVIPSLVNSGIDIYNSVLGIPATKAEEVNDRLFVRHFQKSPLHHAVIPIKTELGEVVVELDVYQGGDIFIKYGARSQWFVSPLADQEVYFSFSGIAHAQEMEMETGIGNYYQFDRITDDKILRELYFLNSAKTKKSYVIDPVTGDWSSPEIGTYEVVPSTDIPEINTFKYPVIDLTE